MPSKYKCDLKLALKRFRASAEAEQEMRMRMLEDLRFSSGEQWPEELRRERSKDGRPCLTLDRTEQFVHQVTNEIRQNKVEPKASPVDDQADVETAEVIEGIFRHIFRRSKADTARVWAAEYAVRAGRGWYRVRPDWEAKDSFDQDIFIERIKYQAGVYADPAAQKPDYSDGRYLFIVEDIQRDEYKDEYKDSELSSIGDFSNVGNSVPEWISTDSVRIAEYFWFDSKERTLCLLSDGTTAWLEDLPEGAPVIKTRTAEDCRLYWSKINGIEVLDERECPGSLIPVVPVLGEELVVDGKTLLSGMVHRMKDAQRQINYMRSAQVEAIALAPRAPWLVAVGQTEEFGEWQTANTRNHARLRYKPTGIPGEMAAPPQRLVAEPAIQGITMALQQSVDDMKASTGIYDASLGARSNEKSGVAIQARQREGDTASYHYFDNFNIALNYEGQVILDLLPKIYDRPGRVARIVGAEGEEKKVALGEPTLTDSGIEKIYDLSIGRYDVAITTGPGYSTKRKEAADAFIQLASQIPIMGNIAPDLIVETLDVPGSQKLAKRLKKGLPPGIAEDDNNNPQAQAQAAMAKLQQSQHLIEALTQQLNVVSEEIKTQRVQSDSKERIEMARLDLDRERLQAEIGLGMAKLGSAEAIAQLREEVAALKHESGLGHQARMKQADQEHAISVKQMDQEHQQEMMAQQPSESSSSAE